MYYAYLSTADNQLDKASWHFGGGAETGANEYVNGVID